MLESAFDGIYGVLKSLRFQTDIKIPLKKAVFGFGAFVGQKNVGEQAAGLHEHAFDMHGMPRGMYIVKVSTGSYREAKSINIW